MWLDSILWRLIYAIGSGILLSAIIHLFDSDASLYSPFSIGFAITSQVQTGLLAKNVAKQLTNERLELLVSSAQKSIRRITQILLTYRHRRDRIVLEYALTELEEELVSVKNNSSTEYMGVFQLRKGSLGTLKVLITAEIVDELENKLEELRVSLQDANNELSFCRTSN